MIAGPSGCRLFHAVAMVFVTCLIISNIVAIKVVIIWKFVLPAGIIVFPIAYIFGDILTEVYGYSKTRSVIWWGFFCLAGMTLLSFVAVQLPPAPFWKDQESFARVFGFVPRITASSLLAYLVGEFLNSIVMSRLKVTTNGRHLWLRAIGSTMVGEGADSIVFNLAAFGGVFAFSDVAFIALSGFVLKCLYEVIALPVTYLIVGWLKRVEEIDTFDRGISYALFKME